MKAWRRLSLLLLALPYLPLAAAEYQWSASVDPVVSSETLEHPRAFLWIPPPCRQVRAVVIGQHNMEEEPILEHPQFRKTMAELCFAEIWATPAMGSNHFRFDQGAGQMLDTLLRALADKSGYAELAGAPLVPIGHSAMAGFGWDVAAWQPQRVLAVISSSGQWPYMKEAGTPDWGERTVDGVPGLTIKGEYEVQGNMKTGWYAGLKGDSLITHPATALTHVIEPGGGHFEVSSRKIALLSLYLRKAAQYRLPSLARRAEPASARLRPIDPRRQGWLFDGWQLDTDPAAPAAPVADYKGKRDEAYWAFDAEMARAIEDFQGRFRRQPAVLLGYRQNEGLTAPRADHAMVHLKFEPLGDGMTFKLAGGFHDRVPGDGKPDKDKGGAEGTGGWGAWLSEGRNAVNAGDPLAHPGPDQLAAKRIARICGPVAQIGPDTFAIRFYRMGMNNAKRSNDMWFSLTWPGDGQYKQMVQQAELQFPLTNKAGQGQTIAFPDIPDQRGGAGTALAPLRLGATSSAGQKVYYYVREGPAEVDDDGVLRFTAIPPRARLPIQVTVVAWQWGRSIEPKVQSAAPVEQRFMIYR
ncbi:MAG: hypothetical protein ABIT83_21905 [Massilia sp.]